MQLTQEQEAESVFFQSLDPSQNYESTNELAVSATCGELRIALKKALSMQSEEVEGLKRRIKMFEDYDESSKVQATALMSEVERLRGGDTKR